MIFRGQSVDCMTRIGICIQLFFVIHVHANVELVLWI